MPSEELCVHHPPSLRGTPCTPVAHIFGHPTWPVGTVRHEHTSQTQACNTACTPIWKNTQFHSTYPRCPYLDHGHVKVRGESPANPWDLLSQQDGKPQAEGCGLEGPTPHVGPALPPTHSTPVTLHFHPYYLLPTPSARTHARKAPLVLSSMYIYICS